MNKVAKKWAIGFVACVLALLVLAGGIIVYIDPYFHYHGPVDGLYYELNNERSQNDGIMKHFDYDAMIIGTSMAANFKTSELDELFGVHSIKVPLLGASFNEINTNMEAALAANPDLKLVVRSLDYNNMFEEPDRLRDDLGTYPTYLYDDNIFNDVKYVFNKDVLFQICLPMVGHAIAGQPAGITSFDDYSNWMNDGCTFGKDTVLAGIAEIPEPVVTYHLTDEEREIISANMQQNVLVTAQAHPDVDFYYFITPYSVVWWGGIRGNGNLFHWTQAEQYMIEQILQCDNIHLFSFNTQADISTNLDNFKDPCHYGEWINSRMLEDMQAGRNQITWDNYEEYIAAEIDLYNRYPYYTLFEE